MLTKREREVLQLFYYSNKQIAQILVISTYTVKTHIQNIFNKLEEYTKSKALIKALKMGIINIYEIQTDYIDIGFWNNLGKYQTKMEKIKDE